MKIPINKDQVELLKQEIGNYNNEVISDFPFIELPILYILVSVIGPFTLHLSTSFGEYQALKLE